MCASVIWLLKSLSVHEWRYLFEMYLRMDMGASLELPLPFLYYDIKEMLNMNKRWCDNVTIPLEMLPLLETINKSSLRKLKNKYINRSIKRIILGSYLKNKKRC